MDRFLNEDLDFPTLPGISRLAGQGLNLYETDDLIVAEAAVPGVPEDRIDITVDGRVVRISGSFEEKEEDRGKRRYFMSSMASSFNYSFRLPDGVAIDKEPTVEFDNGILRLEFPKLKKQAPKRIKISVKAKESKGK
ncbi:MAG: Hsp20/alpha crystallin family protein [Candidatus Daviesbacteria bacterium]|nr:Hsp20/alpha crystallin family protein [Candidatus Daviesbacteria bacterium]